MQSINHPLLRFALLLCVPALRYAQAGTIDILNVPTIMAGSAGTAISVTSYTRSGSDFTLTKPVDAFSPFLIAADVKGTVFPNASLQVFDPAVSPTVPTLEYDFSQILFTSDAMVGAVNGVPTEIVRFHASSVTTPTATPEPGTLLLVGLSLCCIWFRRA